MPEFLPGDAAGPVTIWRLLPYSPRFFFGAALRAVLVIDGGGWETDVEVELPWSASALWPLVSDAASREEWQAGASDILPLKREDGHIGSRHHIWYVRSPETWQGTETTIKWVPERLFATYSESDRDERNFSVELFPAGECLTRLRVREVTRLKSWKDRYLALWDARGEDARAEGSIEYLRKLARKEIGECAR